MHEFRLLAVVIICLLGNPSAHGSGDAASSQGPSLALRHSPQLILDTAQSMLGQLETMPDRVNLSANGGFQAALAELVANGIELNLFSPESPMLAELFEDGCVCGSCRCVACESALEFCPPPQRRLGVRCARYCGSCGTAAGDVPEDDDLCGLDSTNEGELRAYCCGGCCIDAVQMLVRSVFCCIFFHAEIACQHQAKFADKARLVAILQHIIAAMRVRFGTTPPAGGRSPTLAGTPRHLVPCPEREADHEPPELSEVGDGQAAASGSPQQPRVPLGSPAAPYLRRVRLPPTQAGGARARTPAPVVRREARRPLVREGRSRARGPAAAARRVCAGQRSRQGRSGVSHSARARSAPRSSVPSRKAAKGPQANRRSGN